MTLLSVHLITYNNENYIEATLKSILNQNVDFEFEIVVGDDCSTDNTLHILNKYDKNYPNLFKIKKNKKQLGILKNFKSTLDRCNGYYVFDIAGDDLLKHKYSLQKMINAFREDTNLGFIDSGFDILNDSDKSIKKFENKNDINCTEELYKTSATLGRISPIGLCYNKEKLYKHVDFDTYLNMNLTIEDYPIIVDLVMNTKFKRINESLHLYRVHDTSYSHEKNFDKMFFQKKQMKTIFSFFSKKYKFDDDTIMKYENSHFKEILFYSGYYEKKVLGKEVFSKIKQKSFKDYIHYWASQNKLFRKLVSML